MANMRMAKKSSSPICRSGTMAFMMDLSTTCKPGGRADNVGQVREQWAEQGVGWGYRQNSKHLGGRAESWQDVGDRTGRGGEARSLGGRSTEQ